MNVELFPPEFFNLLSDERFARLDARQNRLVGGGVKKNHSGDSQDFFDYRKYSPGDDIRFVDWNIFNRTRKLFVKKYQATPQDVHVISLDCSGSILFSRDRAFTAWRTAAWLGATLLSGGESIEFRVGKIQHHFSGTGADLRVLLCEFLSEVYDQQWFAGKVDYQLATSNRHWIISDFYDGDDLKLCLEKISQGNFIPVRIYDIAEENPQWFGVYSFRDCETNQRVTLEVDERALECYRQNLQLLKNALSRQAALNGLPLFQVQVSRNLSELGEQLRDNWRKVN